MAYRFASTVLFGALLAPYAAAQEPTDGLRDSPPPKQTQDDAQPNASASDEPLLLSPGHYVLPGPVSPAYWSPHLRPFPDYSQFRRSAGLPRRSFNYRYGAFGAAPSCNSYGWSGGWGYNNGDAEAAYNQGRTDADREYLWYIAAQRAGRLINQHAEKFDAGVRLFREGDYEEALRNLLGAAEADQSRAAPRLHAGHTMFALGRYGPAINMIARAFELSPLLPFKTYDIREEYGNQGDFDKHRDRLRRFAAGHPDDAAAMTLLAYVEFYRRGPGAAHALLVRARRLDPESYFLPKLLAVSASAAGSPDATPNEDEKPESRHSFSGKTRIMRVSARGAP